MNQEALLLVLAGALCHAVWNLLAKRVAGGLVFVWLFGLVSVVAGLPWAIAAWLAQPHALSGAAWVAITASALVHIAYSLVLQKGYRVSDFSLVYPMARGTGPMFAVLGAILVLQEMPSALGWIGIVSVLAGVFLISGLTQGARAATAHRGAGVFWGGVTGLSIAAYTVIDGWAIKALALDPVLYYTLGLALRAVLLAPQALRDQAAVARQWRSHWREIVGVGVLSPLAYLLVLYALRLAPLSYVAPLRELSMLLAVFLGARVLREKLHPAQVLGTFCLLAGVLLLAVAP